MSKKRPYKMRQASREVNCTNLNWLYRYATKKYERRKMSQYSDGGQAYTYGEFKLKCDRLSQRLLRFGISAGDKMAILSQNMPNWTVAFFAATAFGRVAIPILPDSSENEVTNILTHSDSKVIFISQRCMSKLSEAMREKLTLVVDIETFEFIKKDQNAFQCDGVVKDPAPDDLATIIYTSGTTGNAKGVMLSHRNLCHNIIESLKAEPCDKKDRFLSILPMAHAYEMGIGCLYPIFVGACVYYIQKPPTPSILISVMKKIRPTVMCSVPLIIEKVYKSSIVPTVKRSKVLTWMQAKLPHLFYSLVGGRLYKTFGGKLHFFGVGGGKLDPVVEEFLLKCKFPYAIGYGLTECAPLVSNAMVGRTKVGSIGIASYQMEVRLDNVDPETGEGEIVCRGDNVMLGYYKDPERTLKVIDDEGWFRTGDVATVDEDGYYYIKGRLNNTIVGPSGENIYPEEIEMVLSDMEGVHESLVMERDGKLVALVKFDDKFLDWDQEYEDKFFENLAARKKAVMDFINSKVGKNSKINEVDAVKDPFEKTATGKIRRFKYKDSHGDEPEAPAGTAETPDTPEEKPEVPHE
ncbi:MAG: AMP-binding protein [Bacteroidales bacterium]|nr:AMP-binding protein [Bacteroidales bacterium]